jgi:hypothetical protein
MALAIVLLPSESCWRARWSATVIYAVRGPLLQRLGPGTMFASLYAEVDFRRQKGGPTDSAALNIPLAGTFLPLRARWSITMPELTLRMELLFKLPKTVRL